MSDRVKMPAWLPMSRVLENLGWKRSRLGPGRKGTLFTMRGADRKSNTCKAIGHRAKHCHTLDTKQQSECCLCQL